jgi:hypothetical protein
VSEDLTTGWEPDVPATDTLARAALMATADRACVQGASVDGRVERDDDVVMVDTGSTNPFLNPAFLLRPPTDETVDRVVAFQPGAFTLFGLWPLGDLRGRGLQLMGHPPFMVRPAGGQRPPLPSGLTIEEVDDEGGLIAFATTLIEGFPLSDQAGSEDRFMGPEMIGSASHLYIGRLDGRPVAVAGSHVAYGVNNVEWVATRAEHRGKGYGAAITWAATLADPTLPAVLIASDDGRPVYERMGYLAVERWTLWFRG